MSVEANNTGEVALIRDMERVDADGDKGNFVLIDMLNWILEAQANGAPDESALWVTSDGEAITKLAFRTDTSVLPTPKTPKVETVPQTEVKKIMAVALCLIIVAMFFGIFIGGMIF